MAGSREGIDGVALPAIGAYMSVPALTTFIVHYWLILTIGMLQNQALPRVVRRRIIAHHY